MEYFVLWVMLAAPVAPAAAADDAEVEDGAALSAEQLEELLGDIERPLAPRALKFTEQDFTRYFAEGPAREAKAEFDLRHYAKARALLATAEGDAPLRYLRALSALYGGDPATAAAELMALADEYPALADHCELNAGQAYERLNQRALALEAYAKVREGSGSFIEARFGMARVHKRRQNYSGAIEALEPLRKLPVGGRWNAARLKALVTIGQLARLKPGGRAQERLALFEIWATSPLAPEAAAAWQRLSSQPVPHSWRMRRAETLLALNQNKEALELASKVTTSLPEEQACRAAFITGNVRRKDRQHRKAIAALSPMIERCPSSELRPQALYVMGYSQSVVDRERAIATYEQLAHEYPAHPMADDALYFAAEMYQRTGKDDLALTRLKDVAARYPEGNFAAEALFKTAWILRDRGALDEARATLTAIEKLPQASHEALLRARYWAAHVLAEKADFAAEDLFLELASENPTSWYGTLAQARVEAPSKVARDDAAAASTEAWAFDPGPLAEDPHFAAGVEFLRLGLPGAAPELLSADRRGLPDDAARLLVFALKRAAVEQAADFVTRQTLGRELRGAIDAQSRPVWEATFPRPFRPLVEKHGRAARVDPDLLQALAREESRFNVCARSSTGALGLTQLMPATARKVARDLKLGRVSQSALCRPEVNLKLGAAYLGSLLKEFDGSVPHAVAAYNAGPEAVHRWMKERPEADLDRWVEAIPFAETRDYVKHVLASYAAYQHVYPAVERVAARSDEASE